MTEQQQLTATSILIMGSAINARIEAMKVDNAARAAVGSPPAYDSSHFWKASAELEAYATRLESIATEWSTEEIPIKKSE